MDLHVFKLCCLYILSLKDVCLAEASGRGCFLLCYILIDNMAFDYACFITLRTDTVVSQTK